MDEVIEKKFNRSAFVKLSTRSPKDAITGQINEKLKNALIEGFWLFLALFNLLHPEMKKSDGSENGDSVAFVKSSRKCLRVTSGEEALQVRVFVCNPSSNFVLP